MSCYLCSDEHIATIAVTYSIKARLPPEEAQLLADKLKFDNIVSVNYHYDNQTPFEPCSLKQRDSALSNAGLVGLCNCLEYQSCGFPDYDPTLLRAIRAVLAGDMSPAEISEAWLTMD